MIQCTRIFIIVFLFTFMACKKKESKSIQKTPPELASNYFPLKKGNYWIYEQFESDTNHNVKSLHIFDSVYVVGETNFKNKTYVLVCNQDHYDPKMDSIDYYYFEGEKAIDSAGQTVFSSIDFSSILNHYELVFGKKDTLLSSISKMDHTNLITTVKAGSFSTISYQTISKTKDDFCPLVKYFPIDEKRYALNIGIVYETLFGYCDFLKKRHRELVRYHLN